MTSSLSRVVEAFNISQDSPDWAAMTSLSQCGIERGGNGGGEGGDRGGDRGGEGGGGERGEDRGVRAGESKGVGDSSNGQASRGSNDGSYDSRGETLNTLNNCSSHDKAALDTFHLTSQPSTQSAESEEGSFFSHGGIMTNTLTIFERACSGGGEAGLFPPLPHTTPLPKKPDMAAFRLFCTVLVRAYEYRKKELQRVIEEGQGEVMGGGIREGMGGKTDEEKKKEEEKEKEKGDIRMKNGYIKRESSTDSTNGEPTVYSSATLTVALQDRLQHCLDELDIQGVAAAVSRGAVVHPALIRQAAQYFGDEHFPLFALLLTYGELYMAGR